MIDLLAHVGTSFNQLQDVSILHNRYGRFVTRLDWFCDMKFKVASSKGTGESVLDDMREDDQVVAGNIKSAMVAF
jgi:hypothetical protein